MSRILRRPMFRGGPVDSYGTGIATGLGTRSGYYRGGGVSYNPFNKAQTSNLLGRNTSKVLPDLSQFGKSKISSIFNPVQITPEGFQKSSPMPGSDEYAMMMKNLYPGSDYGEPISEEDIEESLKLGDIRETYTTREGKEIDFGRSDRIEKGLFGSGVFDKADELRERRASYVPGSLFNKTEAPGLEAKRQQNIADLENIEKMDNIQTVENNKNNKEGGDEVEVTMTDLEKALGLDKARRRDLGDMLGRASAAFLGAGDVREGLAEFMAAETKAGPSRTERIKSIAGLEEFKAKKAQELYDKKTAALLKQKEGTKGAFQKKLETITDQKENTPGHKIALAELKLEPTIQGQIQSDTIDNNYTKPSPAVIIGYMDLYYPQSYKGTVSATDEMTGKEAGTYITEDATQIIFWDGTDARTQSI